jgi:AcrR family transcriptional regulator
MNQPFRIIVSISVHNDVRPGHASVNGFGVTEAMESQKTKGTLGRPRSFDTEKALDSAMHMFWSRGYVATTLSDLTAAMGINRPSFYAAFGSKAALFRTVLDRYFVGPSRYLEESLREPTARATVEHLLHGVVNMLTDPRTPSTCMWVHGALSSGNDPLQAEFDAQRAAGHADLRRRLQRAVLEGDLPNGTDADALARFIQTVNFGLTVQASTGATRKQLLRVVENVLLAWPILSNTR